MKNKGLTLIETMIIIGIVILFTIIATITLPGIKKSLQCPEGYIKQCTNNSTGIALWLVTGNPGFIGYKDECNCIRIN
jgi:hypothetical protein